MSNSKYNLLFGKAAAYCSLSEHCISEVTEKLQRWDADNQLTTEIIEHLISEKYIDEQRFANAYARDKFRFNKWGKIKIRMLLQQKNIDNETVNNALDCINTEDYQNVLRQLLNAKSKSVKSSSEYEKRAKLTRFACGRGFELSEIEKALK
ncbi:MAG: RecX family transcriptional regulator [Prevotellaceae bacterium]|jgi:regulatory protein|nr:RecX family transcriptional regulator [Prevotellaceae bacterium]